MSIVEAINTQAEAEQTEGSPCAPTPVLERAASETAVFVTPVKPKKEPHTPPPAPHVNRKRPASPLSEAREEGLRRASRSIARLLIEQNLVSAEATEDTIERVILEATLDLTARPASKDEERPIAATEPAAE